MIINSLPLWKFPVCVVYFAFKKNILGMPSKSNIYLRTLLTHIVNNLLQQLTYVKHVQYSVIKQTINIIYIMCENFRIKPWVLSKIQHI